MNDNELIEAASGLMKSDISFLWVIHKSSSSPIDIMKDNAKLLDGFEDIFGETGNFVEWEPHKEVLAHSVVGGFWSHCGWNSMMESISKGVPMICKPSFSDQMINARYGTHVSKVRVQLERSFDRSDVEKAVSRIMVDELYRNEIRKRALGFKHKFEVSMQKGGSSNESLEKFINFISSHYVV